MPKGYLRKKLSLNKQTIVHLGKIEMKGLHGAVKTDNTKQPNSSYPIPTCNPCPETLGTQNTLDGDPIAP